LLAVRFTPTGRAQFLDVVSQIRVDDRAAAKRFRKRAERILRRLELLPQSGRVIPEFPDLPFREVVVPPYRFFYRVVRKTKTVWVVAVWHGAQLPLQPASINVR
jgi:toxin ParE1/3/4